MRGYVYTQVHKWVWVWVWVIINLSFSKFFFLFCFRSNKINTLSAGQLNVLKKISLLRLTALLERYSCNSRSGWHWYTKFIFSYCYLCINLLQHILSTFHISNTGGGHCLHTRSIFIFCTILWNVYFVIILYNSTECVLCYSFVQFYGMCTLL